MGHLHISVSNVKGTDTCREVPLSMTGESSAGTGPAGCGKSTEAVSNYVGFA